MKRGDYSTTPGATGKKQTLAIGAEMIRLLIVEDDPAVRQGLHMLFATEADVAVIGDVLDGVAAAELVTKLHPDVVLMDAEMQHMDGIAAVCGLHLACPQASIVVLSMNDGAYTRARVAAAGAVALVAKSMPTETLLSAIRRFTGGAKAQDCLAIASDGECLREEAPSRERFPSQAVARTAQRIADLLTID